MKSQQIDRIITAAEQRIGCTPLLDLTHIKGKTIAALLPDTGERYLSTPMFS